MNYKKLRRRLQHLIVKAILYDIILAYLLIFTYLSEEKMKHYTYRSLFFVLSLVSACAHASDEKVTAPGFASQVALGGVALASLLAETSANKMTQNEYLSSQDADPAIKGALTFSVCVVTFAFWCCMCIATSHSEKRGRQRA